MARIEYSEFDLETSIVVRRGLCETAHVPPPAPGHGIALIASRPGRQRIEHDGLDSDSCAIHPRIVALTADEISASRPRLGAETDLPARVTRGQWQALLARIEALERRL